MNDENTHYFRLYLTENEHYIVEGYLKDFCQKNNLEFIYYRTLKNGHVPCVREIKVKGERWKIEKFLWDYDINTIPKEEYSENS